MKEFHIIVKSDEMHVFRHTVPVGETGTDSETDTVIDEAKRKNNDGKNEQISRPVRFTLQHGSLLMLHCKSLRWLLGCKKLGKTAIFVMYLVGVSRSTSLNTLKKYE